jgi:hypothetical protein
MTNELDRGATRGEASPSAKTFPRRDMLVPINEEMEGRATKEQDDELL